MSFLRTLLILVVGGIFFVLQGCQTTNMTSSMDLLSNKSALQYACSQGSVLHKKLIIKRGLSCSEYREDKGYMVGASKNKPLASVSDAYVCYNATYSRGGKKLWNDRNDNFVGEAKYRGLDCGVIEDNKTIIASKPKTTKPSISSAELEKEKQKRISLQRKADEEERKRKALEQRIAELEKKNKELQKPKKNNLLNQEVVVGQVSSYLN